MLSGAPSDKDRNTDAQRGSHLLYRDRHHLHRGSCHHISCTDLYEFQLCYKLFLCHLFPPYTSYVDILESLCLSYLIQSMSDSHIVINWPISKFMYSFIRGQNPLVCFYKDHTKSQVLICVIVCVWKTLDISVKIAYILTK